MLHPFPADGPRPSAAVSDGPDGIDPSALHGHDGDELKHDRVIALDAVRAPKTVNNFVFLALHHYYDGVIFHRIIGGFMCQGGDPTGTGRGGPGYRFDDELPKAGQYELGSVAMANAGPNTNGSQFFIISGNDGVRLPPQYSLFGKVVKGMEVVEPMQKVSATTRQTGPAGRGDPVGDHHRSRLLRRRWRRHSAHS
jgi:cyclophilin family peptidyl-prolyl cis-trans isomerase